MVVWTQLGILGYASASTASVSDEIAASRSAGTPVKV
jgi:hypothetical protein